MIATPFNMKFFFRLGANIWWRSITSFQFNFNSVGAYASVNTFWLKWFELHKIVNKAMTLYNECQTVIDLITRYQYEYLIADMLGNEADADEALELLAKWLIQFEDGVVTTEEKEPVDIWAHLPTWDEDEPRKVSYEIVKGEVVTVVYGESTRLF